MLLLRVVRRDAFFQEMVVALRCAPNCHRTRVQKFERRRGIVWDYLFKDMRGENSFNFPINF
jgi:hypothetical protein